MTDTEIALKQDVPAAADARDIIAEQRTSDVAFYTERMDEALNRAATCNSAAARANVLMVGWGVVWIAISFAWDSAMPLVPAVCGTIVGVHTARSWMAAGDEWLAECERCAARRAEAERVLDAVAKASKP